MNYELNIGKTELDHIFKDDKGRKTEEIVPVDIKELKPYAEQPFKVLLDSSMDELCESIEQYGVLSPVIVRPHKDGELDGAMVEHILTVGKEEKVKLVIYEDKLRRYFPKSYTKEQIEDTVMKLIQKWHKNREKENEL